MAIGEKLAKLLEEKKKKPGTLARETGINKNTIYSILRRNNNKVNYSNVERIASNLGVPVEYFFDSQRMSADTEIKGQQTLTHDELSLLSKYRALDDEHKVIVTNVLETVYNSTIAKEQRQETA